MTDFIPGKIVKTVTSKKGDEITIRYPKWEDLDEMTTFVNAMSQEDTYINMSGEQLSKIEEAEFLKSFLTDIEGGDKVYLAAFIEKKMIGSCSIERDKKHRRRALHVGIFGIMLRQEYRGAGVGYELATTTIDEAKKRIQGLKMITLTCFACNVKARGLYEKIGFKKWGQLPQALQYKGEYLDEVTMFLSLES